MPSPHGHQAQKIISSPSGSEVKSRWPGQRPPRWWLIVRTISGALPIFELSQATWRDRSKIARTSSFLSAPNSAKTVSNRPSHFHDKLPWKALNSFLHSFSGPVPGLPIPLTLSMAFPVFGWTFLFEPWAWFSGPPVWRARPWAARLTTSSSGRHCP